MPQETSSFEWTDSYRLGIPGVDAEHRTFFSLLHDLEASREVEDGPAAREALKRLRGYAETHFGHEEEFLDAVGYPDLARHRLEHEEFLRDVTVLEATPGLPSVVAVRMARAWIGQHILGTDRRYTQWLDEAGGAAALGYPKPR